MDENRLYTYGVNPYGSRIPGFDLYNSIAGLDSEEDAISIALMESRFYKHPFWVFEEGTITRNIRLIYFIMEDGTKIPQGEFYAEGGPMVRYRDKLIVNGDIPF